MKRKHLLILAAAFAIPFTVIFVRLRCTDELVASSTMVWGNRYRQIQIYWAKDPCKDVRVIAVTVSPTESVPTSTLVVVSGPGACDRRGLWLNGERIDLPSDSALLFITDEQGQTQQLQTSRESAADFLARVEEYSARPAYMNHAMSDHVAAIESEVQRLVSASNE